MPLAYRRFLLAEQQYLLNFVFDQQLNILVGHANLLALRAVAVKQRLTSLWNVHTFEVFLEVIDVALPLELELHLVVLTQGLGVHVSRTPFRDGSEYVREVAEQVVFSFHEVSQFCALLLNRRIKVLFHDRSPSSLVLGNYRFLLYVAEDFKLRDVELV